MFMYNPNMGLGEGELEEGDEGMDLTGLKDEELEEAEKDIVVSWWRGDDRMSCCLWSLAIFNYFVCNWERDFLERSHHHSADR